MTQRSLATIIWILLHNRCHLAKISANTISILNCTVTGCSLPHTVFGKALSVHASLILLGASLDNKTAPLSGRQFFSLHVL